MELAAESTNLVWIDQGDPPRIQDESGLERRTPFSDRVVKNWANEAPSPLVSI